MSGTIGVSIVRFLASKRRSERNRNPVESLAETFPSAFDLK